MTNSLYTVQVKFDKSGSTYDYACNLQPCPQIGDKAVVVGAYGEVKQVEIVNLLPLTDKTTKAVAGVVLSVDHYKINEKLSKRVELQKKIDVEVKKLERKFLEQYMAQTNPQIAKLIKERDAL